MNDFSFIKHDRIIFYSFVGSFCLFFVGIIYSLLFLSKLPPVLPLFNQMPWGEGRLGTKLQLFFPLLIVFIVVCTNSFLESKFYSATPLLARMLSLASLLLAFLVLLFIVRTVGLLL